MASITEERLKEMEEEMNRFEEEISNVQPPLDEGGGRFGPYGAHKMIIGSNTFHQVQRKLATNQDDGPPEPKRPLVMHDPDRKKPFPGSRPPPPPPTTTAGPQLPPGLSLKPPPPPPLGGPPGPRPAFLPPQLRHRPPLPPSGRPPFPHQGGLPPPPRPPFGGPPRGMLPPPPMGGGPHPYPGGPQPPPHPGGPHHPGGPPHFGPGGMPPHPMNMPYNPMFGPGPGPGPPPMPQPPVKVAADTPKVVYAAPPVRNVPIKEKKEKKKEEIVEKNEPEPIPMETAPIVEVNVSTEQVEAQSSSSGLPPGGAPEGEAEVVKREKKEKKKKYIRTAAGQQWEDNTLGDWEQDDFRIFCGDLGNEVTEEILARAFSRYPSFLKAKVVRDKRTNKTRGYGFVSFKDPNDFVRAMREVNGKYVGNRPIKLRKSAWRERQSDVVKKKEKEKKKLGFK